MKYWTTEKATTTEKTERVHEKVHRQDSVAGLSRLGIFLKLGHIQQPV